MILPVRWERYYHGSKKPNEMAITDNVTFLDQILGIGSTAAVLVAVHNGLGKHQNTLRPSQLETFLKVRDWTDLCEAHLPSKWLVEENCILPGEFFLLVYIRRFNSIFTQRHHVEMLYGIAYIASSPSKESSSCKSFGDRSRDTLGVYIHFRHCISMQIASFMGRCGTRSLPRPCNTSNCHSFLHS